jgi:hypothetical protein
MLVRFPTGETWFTVVFLKIFLSHDKKSLYLVQGSVMCLVGPSLECSIHLRSVPMRIFPPYLWYWGLNSPSIIIFDPQGVRAYVKHKSCWKIYALTESAEKWSQFTLRQKVTAPTMEVTFWS